MPHVKIGSLGDRRFPFVEHRVEGERHDEDPDASKGGCECRRRFEYTDEESRVIHKNNKIKSNSGCLHSSGSV